MKTSAKQCEEILPLLQKIVQAKIDQWEAEGEIEGILNTELSGMNSAGEYFAVIYDRGTQVTLVNVDEYLDQCQED